MSALISPTDAPAFYGKHICRAWFGTLDFPDGVAYLHSESGPYVIDGVTYRGVSDPTGGRLVSIGEIPEPTFGVTASFQITLTGVSQDFFDAVRDDSAAIEGRSASLAFVVFDKETEARLTSLIVPFPHGSMSQPSTFESGVGIRAVTLTIESIWNAKNFAINGKYDPASQKRLYPGDLIFDLPKQFNENWLS